MFRLVNFGTYLELVSTKCHSHCTEFKSFRELFKWLVNLISLTKFYSRLKKFVIRRNSQQVKSLPDKGMKKRVDLRAI